MKGRGYNPLSTHAESEELDIEDLMAPALPLLERLNNYSDKIREQTLVLLANLDEGLSPADTQLLNDPFFVGQVLCRLEEDSPSILHPALFAVRNLCLLSLTRHSYLTRKTVAQLAALGARLHLPQFGCLAEDYFLSVAVVLEAFGQE